MSLGLLKICTVIFPFACLGLAAARHCLLAPQQVLLALSIPFEPEFQLPYVVPCQIKLPL
jgi:hypothetical protein